MRAAVTGESRPPPYPFPEFLEFLFEICSRASKGRNFEEICGPRPQVRLSLETKTAWGVHIALEIAKIRFGR